MRRITTAAIAACLAACGGGSAPQPRAGNATQAVASNVAEGTEAKADDADTKGPPQTKDDVAALMARELKSLPRSHAVRAVDGSWSLVAPSKTPPRLSGAAGVAKFQLDLGTGAPVICGLRNKVLDPGGSTVLALSSKSGRQTVALSPIGVVHAGTIPVLSTRSIYKAVDKSGEPVVSELKYAITTHHHWTLSCAHDQFGYEQTFTELTRAIAATVKFKSPPPLYASLEVASIDGHRIGFLRTIKDNRPSGVVINETMVLTIPVSKTESSYRDEVSNRNLDKSGRILRGAWASGLNGTLESTATIIHKRHGKYSVTGKRKGQAIAAEFTTRDKKPLLDSFTRARLHRSKLKAGAVMTYQDFSPGDDPAKLTTKTLHVDATNPKRYWVDLGDTKLHRVVDEHGMPIGGAIELKSGVRIEIERVAAQGTP